MTARDDGGGRVMLGRALWNGMGREGVEGATAGFGVTALEGTC